jgi:hypothetical protein
MKTVGPRMKTVGQLKDLLHTCDNDDFVHVTFKDGPKQYLLRVTGVSSDIHNEATFLDCGELRLEHVAK